MLVLYLAVTRGPHPPGRFSRLSCSPLSVRGPRSRGTPKLTITHTRYCIDTQDFAMKQKTLTDKSLAHKTVTHKTLHHYTRHCTEKMKHKTLAQNTMTHKTKREALVSQLCECFVGSIQQTMLIVDSWKDSNFM